MKHLAAATVTLFVFGAVTHAPLGHSKESEPSEWDRARPTVIATLNGRRIAQGEILIGLQSWSDRERVLAHFGGEPNLLGQFPTLRLLRIGVPPGEEATSIATANTLLGVAYAETNGIGEGGGSTNPNDTFFSSQWHHQNSGQTGGTPGADIESVGAWGIQTGSADVVVAVLDSGIDFTNPEFTGRTLPGHDFVNEDADPTFDHPHGVNVTGLLAANADNNFGVAGVDQHCTILPVKVLNAANAGTVTDLVQGINYSIAQGVDIVSMSLINYPASASLINALSAARSAGLILMACGGNLGTGNADVTYPGASPFTISIGWTNDDDVRSSSSGTGNALDFVAPGVSVRTVNANGTNSASLFSGCSAATPVAAGIVALLKAQYPPLTQDQAYDLLRAGAEDQVGPAAQDTPGKDVFYGHGRLNALRSLKALCACDGNEVLIASPQQVSLSSGGTQLLRIDAGSSFAGSTYFVLGSVSGTTPGFAVGSTHLPLNYDSYTNFLLSFPNTIIASSLGTLDGLGKGEAVLTVPAGAPASLAGLTLNHASLLFSGIPSTATAQLASNDVALELTP